MKKEEIRKEYFKLRIKGHSQNQCRKILFSQLGYEVSKRTLQRWTRRLNEGGWDLKDNSRKPRTVHTKITPEIEQKVLEIRSKTGFGPEKISSFINDVSESSIKRILIKNSLTNPSHRRKSRIKYVRWQRNHVNSLWQMDVSDQKIEGKYCLAVIDDCSRYCVGLIDLNRVTTDVVTHVLDKLFEKYGKPREILTDNGSVFGLKSRHSKFDRWCRKRGIKYIRTTVHSPTTTGKIERFFQSLSNELPFFRDHNDFRMKYNHFRPHKSLNRRIPADIYFDLSMLA